jgi:hypothetical protein
VAAEVGIWIEGNLLVPAAISLAVGAIDRAARKTISKRKAARRTQRVRELKVIYGPSNEVLSRVRLPAEEADEEARSGG